jgi:hypothetical protein
VNDAEWELKKQAKEIYSPWQGYIRETLATVSEIRSELIRNGIEHSTDNLVDLARLVLAQSWGWPKGNGPSP